MKKLTIQTTGPKNLVEYNQRLSGTRKLFFVACISGCILYTCIF
ncbi:MAG: hypothetical protein ACPHY8_03780 [Patescibacteria group bacterium]